MIGKASGKRKGGEFERDFCKKLSLWWTEGERDDVFFRTSGSGGRASVRAEKGKKTSYHYGDITCVPGVDGETFLDLFMVELKRGYGKWCILDILDSKQKIPIIVNFWKDMERKIERIIEVDSTIKIEPLLVFQRNYRSEVVVLSFFAWNCIEDCVGKFKGSVLEVKVNSMRIKMIKLKAFFNWISPKIIKRKILRWDW